MEVVIIKHIMSEYGVTSTVYSSVYCIIKTFLQKIFYTYLFGVSSTDNALIFFTKHVYQTETTHLTIELLFS